MANRNFKFIKGKCCTGSPADICFYTDVEYWSVKDFLWEFDYLVNYINPSQIRIHVNSTGGCVVDGMSVFSKIMDCKIPTATINDALAASMGSIIWAAGDELYMKDYALLMIHNPFCEVDGDKEYNQTTEAFRTQIKTIYMKRFGLSEDEVEKIMNGKEGEDGTFLTTSQAIERGFLKEDHVIETPQVVKDRISAALKGSISDVKQLQAVYALATPTMPQAIIEELNSNIKHNTMEETKLSVFAALVGITGEKATAENVSAKIAELKEKAQKAEATQKALDETKSELTKTKAELAGAQTSVTNLSADLQAAKSALQVYKDAEAKAQEEKVNALIDKAIADCKINKDERETYAKMAKDNFELAENILAKIPARDNLGNIISTANKTEAKDEVRTEEQKVADIVEQIVGKDFKFRSLQ